MDDFMKNNKYTTEINCVFSPFQINEYIQEIFLSITLFNKIILNLFFGGSGLCFFYANGETV